MTDRDSDDEKAETLPDSDPTITITPQFDEITQQLEEIKRLQAQTDELRKQNKQKIVDKNNSSKQEDIRARVFHQQYETLQNKYNTLLNQINLFYQACENNTLNELKDNIKLYIEE